MKKKVKLGLYGCGNRTRALLDSLFLDEEYDVVAAHDIRGESTEAACRKYGGKACATSEELVAHPDVEAFMISLDPFAHPAAFHETLEAGKPIFVEKPIAMSARDAYDMMVAAESRNIPAQVGFMRRYRPKHVAARAYMAENDPGTLFSVNCRWFHAGETEMINMLTNHPDNFRLKVSQIPFHCCHALDVMMLYGGAVKSVSAVGRKVIERPYPSPDEVIATLEFENGCMGSFHYCSVSYAGCIAYRVHTGNYALSFEAGNSLTISHRPPLRSLREDGSGDCRPLYHGCIAPETRQFSVKTVDHLIMLDFLNSVRTGAPMSAPIRAGYRVAELAEAIERSWQEKQTVQLPLTFDPEVNAD